MVIQICQGHPKKIPSKTIIITMLKKFIQHPRCAKSRDFEQITLDQIATPLNKEFPEIPIGTYEVVETRPFVKIIFPDTPY